MRFWLRFLVAILRAKRAPRVSPLDEVRTRHRAWLGDCDPNFHLNDGRYVSISGLSRLTWMVRVGLLPRFRDERWRPIAGGAEVRFYRSIPPLAVFEIATRLLTWDGKYFYIEHRFFLQDQLMARVLVRTLFRRPTGNIAPPEVLSAIGHAGEAPPPGPELSLWIAMAEEARRAAPATAS